MRFPASSVGSSHEPGSFGRRHSMHGLVARRVFCPMQRARRKGPGVPVPRKNTLHSRYYERYATRYKCIMPGTSRAAAGKTGAHEWVLLRTAVDMPLRPRAFLRESKYMLSMYASIYTGRIVVLRPLSPYRRFTCPEQASCRYRLPRDLPPPRRGSRCWRRAETCPTS